MPDKNILGYNIRALNIYTYIFINYHLNIYNTFNISWHFFFQRTLNI